MSTRTDEWRKKRLADLADQMGSKAALGRALGYKSGAFVRQMIEGERPITEKTIEAVHAMPGYAHWFERPGKGPASALVPPPAPAAPSGAFNAITPDEQRLLDDIRVLMDSDREQYALEIAAKASKMREHMEKLLQQFGSKAK